jgi:hypothetical protein
VCFNVFASDVTIIGLNILNFSGSGITISTDDAQGRQLIERVLLQGNTISAGWSGIMVYNWGQDCTIRDIDIKQNTLVNNGGYGIDISAAFEPSTANNQIVNIRVTENIISNMGPKIAVFAQGATFSDSIGNVLSGLERSVYFL